MTFFSSSLQEVHLLAQNPICIFAAVAAKVPLAHPDMSNGGFYVFRREQSTNGLVCVTNGHVCASDSAMPWQTAAQSSHFQPNTFGELQMHFVLGYMCRSRTNAKSAGLRMVTSLVQPWNMKYSELPQLFEWNGNLETHFNFQVADNLRLNCCFFLNFHLVSLTFVLLTDPSFIPQLMGGSVTSFNSLFFPPFYFFLSFVRLSLSFLHRGPT